TRAEAEQDLLSAQQERNDTQEALANAEANAEAMRVALENAKALLAVDAADYFDKVGSTDAYRVLTDPDVTRYLDDIDIGGETDATSIENLLQALAFIEEANDIRSS